MVGHMMLSTKVKEQGEVEGGRSYICHLSDAALVTTKPCKLANRGQQNAVGFIITLA